MEDSKKQARKQFWKNHCFQEATKLEAEARGKRKKEREPAGNQAARVKSEKTRRRSKSTELESKKKKREARERRSKSKKENRLQEQEARKQEEEQQEEEEAIESIERRTKSLSFRVTVCKQDSRHKGDRTQVARARSQHRKRDTTQGARTSKTKNLRIRKSAPRARRQEAKTPAQEGRKHSQSCRLQASTARL